MFLYFHVLLCTTQIKSWIYSLENQIHLFKNQATKAIPQKHEFVLIKDIIQILILVYLVW